MTLLQNQSLFASILAVGASVPIGTSGIVTVWGRNDMTTSQQMGIHWVVKDPDGIIVEDYYAWEMWPYAGPGEEHKFDGGRFDIAKPGTWTISINLLMNQADPVIVDTYDGVLCVVTEVFAGTITKKELKYDSVVGDIPVY
ncbi:hypothetical protein ES703_26776 [subsurface metagenome]